MRNICYYLSADLVLMGPQVGEMAEGGREQTPRVPGACRASWNRPELNRLLSTSCASGITLTAFLPTLSPHTHPVR